MASLARACTVLLAVAVAACGEGGGGALEVEVDDPTGGLVEIDDVECERDGDRLTASGVVHNEGDNPHHVNFSVRFVDGDGVRVELSSDSVNDLVTGESARWDVNVYSADRAGSVVRCEVSANVT